MLDDSGDLTDLSQLRVPQVGSLAATGDLFQPYRLLDAAGAPIPAADTFFAELLACGRSAATLRSHGMDLLRWFRFLSAVGVEWGKASRVEAREFCRWLTAAPKPARERGRPLRREVTGSTAAVASHAATSAGSNLSSLLIR